MENVKLEFKDYPLQGYSFSLLLQGDFLIEDKYFIEVGEKGKGFKQIKDIDNNFVVTDDVEIGSGNKIPFWLFGFLYQRYL